MENTPFPEILLWSPRPGQKVRWRKPKQVAALGWLDVYGAGPFEVVFVIDRSWQSLPDGLILRTKRGEREINAFLLAPAEGTA